MRSIKKTKFYDAIYSKYNKFQLIHPDPLEFVHKYKNKKEQEIVGLIAALLAYGRVKQILKSVDTVLNIMNPSPHNYIVNTSTQKIISDFKNFKHRFTTGKDFSRLLIGIKNVLQLYGSLEKCFIKYYDDASQENIIPALQNFVEELGGSIPGFLPDPAANSACKRLHLYLRWMVRKDDVDPGCWKSLPKNKLIIPLDTHMHSIALSLRLSSRKQSDIKTAIEITKAFAKINENDPVKYDFSLTRFGIRSELDKKNLLNF